MAVSSAASFFFRSVESDLQGLSQEARKSLPAVKDAAERVLIELRRASAAVSASGGNLAVLRGGALMSQVLHPFIFSCNYADAHKKLLTVALSSVQRFVVADVLSTSDLANLIRVLEIQVSVESIAGKMLFLTCSF
jgi:Dimerisation and cyclophilin-binding domain of Mon2